MEEKELFNPFFFHCILTHPARHHAAWLVPAALGKTRTCFIKQHMAFLQRVVLLYRHKDSWLMYKGRYEHNSWREIQRNPNTDSQQSGYLGWVMSPVLQCLKKVNNSTCLIIWSEPWELNEIIHAKIRVSAWHIIW